MDPAYDIDTIEPQCDQASGAMMLALHPACRLAHDSSDGSWRLSTETGPTPINDVAATILQLATTPIALSALIDEGLRRFPGQLIALDVLAFVEAALAQQWLEYRP